MKKKPTLTNEPRSLNNPSAEGTKKKIVISSVKKDPLDQMIKQVKNEGDFLKQISKLLQVSKKCQSCQSLKASDGQGFYCTNFEALWYHRDTQFAKFGDCSYQTPKQKKVLATVR